MVPMLIKFTAVWDKAPSKSSRPG